MLPLTSPPKITTKTKVLWEGTPISTDIKTNSPHLSNPLKPMNFPDYPLSPKDTLPLNNPTDKLTNPSSKLNPQISPNFPTDQKCQIFSKKETELFKKPKKNILNYKTNWLKTKDNNKFTIKCKKSKNSKKKNSPNKLNSKEKNVYKGKKTDSDINKTCQPSKPPKKYTLNNKACKSKSALKPP